MRRRRHRYRWLPIFVIGSGLAIFVIMRFVPGLGLLTVDTAPGASAPSQADSTPARERPTSTSDADWRAAVVEAVNEVRLRHGLRKVRSCPVLADAAQAYAQEMANGDFFSHVAPDGRALKERLVSAGVKGKRMWENIAAGQPTVERVMKAWLDSPPHRANILEPKARRIGVGMALNPDSTFGVYWVQDFGVRKACRPA